MVLVCISGSMVAQDSSKVNLSTPALMPANTGPLITNPAPLKFNTGLLGELYVSGAVSSLFQYQTGVLPGDKIYAADMSNAQVFIQKATGLFQFFIQAGGYSIPAVGVPYIRAAKATDLYYGLLPQGYVKIAPSESFSVLAGKLPTLIGAEYTFSFENMNIQRGLLWNQENAVNRGVQLNYTKGALSVSLSGNDGFYSKKYTWFWGSLNYAINKNNSVAFIGGGNTRITDITSVATPLYQNNQQIYNIIFTHNAWRFTILPYVQYTAVPQSEKLGTAQKASTYSAAIFVKYSAAKSGFSLPVRLEYLKTTGSSVLGNPNLLYGAGSNAWSATVTPTYQHQRLFARSEFSYVKANDITAGFAFGVLSNEKTQARVILEIGILF